MSRQAGKRQTPAPPGKGKVVVAWLHPENVAASFMDSMLSLFLYDVQGRRRIIEGGGSVSMRSGANITNGRNDVVRNFLDNADAEWLWFVDSDMTFAPDTLERLVAAADPKERPIVGALCFGEWHAPGRRERFPTLYFWDDKGQQLVRAESYPPDTLLPVTCTGTGCLLIHRSVLVEMRAEYPEPYPWFQETAFHGAPWGEDVTFCIRAQQLGYPVHVHTGIKTGHAKYYELDEAAFLRFQERKKPPPVVVTGPGRSGTMWLSEVLRRCNVAAGHEEWFNPFGSRAPDKQVEVSWLALPVVEQKGWPSRVFLQVRDPLRVLSSLWNEEQPRSPEESPYTAWMAEHTNGWTGEDWQADTVRFLVDWLGRGLAVAEKWWRVEDLDAETVVEVAAAAGVAVTLDTAKVALSQVPPTVNKHKPGPAVTWDDVPDIPEKQQLAELAELFGYGGP